MHGLPVDPVEENSIIAAPSPDVSWTDTRESELPWKPDEVDIGDKSGWDGFFPDDFFLLVDDDPSVSVVSRNGKAVLDDLFDGPAFVADSRNLTVGLRQERLGHEGPEGKKDDVPDLHLPRLRS